MAGFKMEAYLFSAGKWHTWAAGLWLVGLVLVCGCGSGLVTVEGQVTWEGKPVEEGNIVFEPADGQGPSAGGKIQNGQYRLAGPSALQPGDKIVRITATRKTGKKVEAGPPVAPPGTLVDEIESFIPAEYNAQSKLRCTIPPGRSHRQDFALPLK
ncbi:MAG TPA: hypothetical protein PK777_06925 [Thermoguttaceae bacterium]|nr:hypothetical protein [Thermoguttaceae bacterium]HPP52662.1 hypothetical protein [Thermoguttaceae bacterium]